ncbi:MAG TPA: hypothetical protein VL286_06985 [Rhizomicrobium sp.]|nr:hypothetical protein [Rhizomicrobium sp.]
MLRGTTALYILAGLALAGATAAAPNTKTTLTCDGQWHTVRAVDVTQDYGDFDSLNAVSGLSSSDVWAVGQYHDFSGTDYDQTLAEHWDGASWKVISTPPPSRSISILFGVSASGPNDVWAVGYEHDVGETYRTLIEHWDGRAWTIVQDGTQQGWLSSVVAIGPSDVWAAGSTDYIGSGLVEHWDGKTWTATLIADGVFLRGIAAINSSDVWVVGQRARNGSGDHTYAAHFDGGKWTRVHTPSPLRQHDIDQNWLTSVAAPASNDVWAVGVTRDPDYGIPDRTLAEHWDGSAWHVVHTPKLRQTGNDFWGVAAAAPNVWAVGSVGTDPNFAPLGEMWDGTSWSRVKTPSPGSLLSVSAIPGSLDLWATGNRVKQDLYIGTLVEHLCTTDN